MKNRLPIAILLAGFIAAIGMTLGAQQQGGSFIPVADYTVSGKWTFSNTTGPVMTSPTITTPVLSGSVTGTYTLAGTPTLTGPAISSPVLSGTATGTYTLAGTPTITSPTITAPTISGASLSSGNFLGVAIQSSASLGGSPVTLTAAQCGQAFALDAATGVVYLMPATFPAVGCTYDFYANTSVTSNSHEIETNNAAHFFNGEALQVAAAATRIDQCNGTSHIAYKTNGSTTGGLLGMHIHVVVQSATVAHIEGLNPGSGTLATACSTTN